jgi:hypothetical protein
VIVSGCSRQSRILVIWQSGMPQSKSISLAVDKT